ncbi:MAG TPA: hypothetical protein VG672_09240 [Bryobacteraceae bacterium]|nr:hypothetical protein [Bryobacteraceae bacterium]
MTVTGRRAALFAAVAAIGLLAISCASGPRPPQPGTPAFYWGAANEMFRAGNYLKTNDNLAQITRSDNEFAARAQPFELVVSAGLAQGFYDLAENYELGARANRANPTPFRKQVNISRGYASNLSLQFTEAFHRFRLSNKDANIALAFGYPTGNASMPPQIKRVTSGIFVQDSEREEIQKAVLQRGVLLSVCRAIGAPDNPAKALEVFQKGEVQVPAAVFFFAMAKALEEQSQLFAPIKLDQPVRMQLLSNEALAALKLVPPSKEVKDLTGKIEKTLKKVKPT